MRIFKRNKSEEMSEELKPLDLPAGFRFHPTDEELVKHYLIKKCESKTIDAHVIAEVDLYNFDPWQLPALAVYGEKDWYFFSPRDRKYPNGSRPNRAAGNGYWKATGADKPIGNPNTLAIKKALVFFAGKAPHGVKTNWIMHEYRLANVDRAAGKGKNLRLDEWVLCRLYNKKGIIEKHYIDQNDQNSANDFEMEEQQPNNSSVSNPMPPPQPQHSSPLESNELLKFETSDSIPKLNANSSGSEYVTSPDFYYEKEVQSEAKDMWSDWEQPLDLEFDNLNSLSSQFAPQYPNSLTYDVYYNS